MRENAYFKTYAITVRYVTLSALPSTRTMNWAVSGIFALIGTEKSAESCGPTLYFLADSIKIDLFHRNSKERLSWPLCH